MSGWIDLQVRDNAESRDRWDLYASHREAVTQLLVQSAPATPGRLCILGAGNCNGLDLNALLAGYREVHLVDLDGEALKFGVKRQGVGDRTAVSAHGGVDVTGVLARMAAWSSQATVEPGDLAACVEAPVQRVRPLLPGRFDVTASVGLLSQLMLAVVQTLGEQHRHFVDALRAVRLGHLRLLADLTVPGGTGVLITDLVSSDTFPTLASVPQNALAGVLAQLIQAHNFFHGVNPAAIAAAIRADPILADRVSKLESVPPWLWNFGPRTYAVVALNWRIAPEKPSSS
jgi:hypothetical protein